MMPYEENIFHNYEKHKPLDMKEPQDEELEIERDRFTAKRLGRCGKCRFLELNYKKGNCSGENFCHVREEHMNKEYVGDFCSILFCRHFKRVDKSKTE